MGLSWSSRFLLYSINSHTHGLSCGGLSECGGSLDQWWLREAMGTLAKHLSLENPHPGCPTHMCTVASVLKSYPINQKTNIVISVTSISVATNRVFHPMMLTNRSNRSLNVMIQQPLLCKDLCPICLDTYPSTHLRMLVHIQSSLLLCRIWSSGPHHHFVVVDTSSYSLYSNWSFLRNSWIISWRSFCAWRNSFTSL